VVAHQVKETSEDGEIQVPFIPDSKTHKMPSKYTHNFCGEMSWELSSWKFENESGG